jgi:hypothetical protein
MHTNTLRRYIPTNIAARDEQEMERPVWQHSKTAGLAVCIPMLALGAARRFGHWIIDGGRSSRRNASTNITRLDTRNHMQQEP